MSIHHIYKSDKSMHFIEEKFCYINYVYVSNIEKDNIYSIIKYTMPMDIEHIFRDKDIIRGCGTPNPRDTLYISLTYEKEHNLYYFTISLAQSEDLELSHRELIRIIGSRVEDIINIYNEFSKTVTYTNRVLSGVRGDAVSIYPPIYTN